MSKLPLKGICILFSFILSFLTNPFSIFLDLLFLTFTCISSILFTFDGPHIHFSDITSYPLLVISPVSLLIFCLVKFLFFPCLSIAGSEVGKFPPSISGSILTYFSPSFNLFQLILWIFLMEWAFFCGHLL